MPAALFQDAADPAGRLEVFENVPWQRVLWTHPGCNRACRIPFSFGSQTAQMFAAAARGRLPLWVLADQLEEEGEGTPELWAALRRPGLTLKEVHR